MKNKKQKPLSELIRKQALKEGYQKGYYKGSRKSWEEGYADGLKEASARFKRRSTKP